MRLFICVICGLSTSVPNWSPAAAELKEHDLKLYDLLVEIWGPLE